MAIKISAIFIILCAPAALSQNGYTGYDYRVPSETLQIPSNLGTNIPQSSNDHAHELQNGFLPSPVNHQHHTGDVFRNEQTQQGLHYNKYNNQGYNDIQSTYQDVNYNSLLPSIARFASGTFVSAQNAQQTLQVRPSFTSVQPQQPVITKHIYFHLPPPDDTTTAATVTRPTPGKTYHIIFIKVPSQESSSAARFQQLVSQQVAAESKTIIYVLVKKPETHLIQPVTSKPEVFFVKYKEPKNVAHPVNTGLVQVPQSSTSGLLPGQINGYVNK